MGSTSRDPVVETKALGGGLARKSVGRDLGLWMEFLDWVIMGWLGAGGATGGATGATRRTGKVEAMGAVESPLEEEETEKGEGLSGGEGEETWM